MADMRAPETDLKQREKEGVREREGVRQREGVKERERERERREVKDTAKEGKEEEKPTWGTAIAGVSSLCVHTLHPIIMYPYCYLLARCEHEKMVLYYIIVRVLRKEWGLCQRASP